jgi:hypothetical protein
VKIVFSKERKQWCTYFLKCNFAKACWNSIGLLPPYKMPSKSSQETLETIASLSCDMDIIILMRAMEYLEIQKCIVGGQLLIKAHSC